MNYLKSDYMQYYPSKMAYGKVGLKCSSGPRKDF